MELAYLSSIGSHPVQAKCTRAASRDTQSSAFIRVPLHMRRDGQDRHGPMRCRPDDQAVVQLLGQTGFGWHTQGYEIMDGAHRRH